MCTVCNDDVLLAYTLYIDCKCNLTLVGPLVVVASYSSCLNYMYRDVTVILNIVCDLYTIANV